MPEAADDAERGLLLAAVCHGVVDRPTWPAEPVEEGVFRGAVERAIRDGLLGAVAEAVHDGVLPTNPDQHQILSYRHGQSQLFMLELERTLLAAVDVLEGSDIPVRVVKGLALAHLVHADPAWRTSKDIDLLVPADRFDDAVAALTVDDAGGMLRHPELRPGFGREFGKEALVKVGRVEVDVHRTLIAGPFGLTIQLDDLLQGRTDFTVGGRVLSAMRPEALFLHCCFTVALGDDPVRLGPVRDLLLCARRLDVRVDRAVDVARGWGATAVLQRAGALTVDLVGEDAAGTIGVLADLEVSRRDRWLLESGLGPARGYRRSLAALSVIPGWSAKARYARAIVLPSQEYLQSRAWTPASHVRRAVRRLVTRR